MSKSIRNTCPNCGTKNPKIECDGLSTLGDICNETIKKYLFGIIKIKCNTILIRWLGPKKLINNYI